VPEQQDAIRQMRELRAQGLAYRVIAARMEAKGHKLSHMTVHKILRKGAMRVEPMPGHRCSTAPGDAVPADTSSGRVPITSTP
jgi:hypothetical protein